MQHGSRPQDSPAGSATAVFLTGIGKDFLRVESALDDLLLDFAFSFKFQNKMKILFQKQAIRTFEHRRVSSHYHASVPSQHDYERILCWVFSSPI